ncbi:MAG: hypothetical protein M3O93_06275 [Chloroflexota bacterium]|nr:hypothetical protein [Chloroflexota bacterium]
MGAILFRIALLSVGLGLAQTGLDSVARGDSVAVIQFGLALLLLVAGAAGFMVPLFARSGRQEVTRHV